MVWPEHGTSLLKANFKAKAGSARKRRTQPAVLHLPTRHFYSSFVWSWQSERAGTGVQSPLLGRFQLQSQLSGQVWEGSGVMSGGQVTLSHGSSSVLLTCVATPPRLTESSICQQGRATLHQQDGRWRGSLLMDKEVRKWERSSHRAAPPGSTLLTCWTDCLFMLSMNMKHPSRFNPALLSPSTRPIVARILVASSRGLRTG